MSQYASLTTRPARPARPPQLQSKSTRSQSSTASATEEQPQTQENGESAPTETGNGESVDTTTAETNNISGAEAVEEKKPEKKVLSPEERKQLAVELLTKKIQRAEKFGDEASATAAKKDLARVEKFGVDPSTALGKEISALGKDVNSELATRKFANKKNKKRGANKGKKVSKK
ncbi:hypothetical protein JCM33374_g4746 [Metschnikowia sp. JCM 33374]|nr:hypothetical protein JCM33374_g4746 [Metschnikowia sp. JCM 33374]